MIIPPVITYNLDIHVDSSGFGLFQLHPGPRARDPAWWQPNPGYFHTARRCPGCQAGAVISNLGQFKKGSNSCKKKKIVHFVFNVRKVILVLYSSLFIQVLFVSSTGGEENKLQARHLDPLTAWKRLGQENSGLAAHRRSVNTDNLLNVSTANSSSPQDIP